MIPNNTRVATIDGSLGGERIQMGFHKDAIVHLMGLLTDLYTDQELACIREYSTNAWDAHIDAGQTRPIEVSTPTMMNPYLKIKDYGVGMFADTIRKVYSQYGASTKRDQTDTNGSMGIGGKAALSLSSQFSVIAVRDGIKTHVAVSRDSSGSAFMEIIDESVTTDHNGVEIIIPVNTHTIERKARDFFQYWEKGRVLLNGVDPSRRDSLDKITDRIYYNPTAYGDIIFMGNVPYPVRKFNALRPSSGGYVVFVTMNGDDEVVFVPSREALMYNEKTEETIAGIEEDLNEQVLTVLRAAMDACKTKPEAMRTRDNWMINYSSHQQVISTITYKGETIPPSSFHIVWDRDEIKQRGWGSGNYGLIWRSSRHRNAVENQTMATTRDVSWIVVNYPKKDKTGLSYMNKQKVREYIHENYPGKSIGNVFFPLGEDGSKIEDREWIEDKFIDWEDIRLIKLNPNTGGYRGGGRPATNGGYNVIDPNFMTKEIVHDLTSDDTVMYYSPKNKIDKEHLLFMSKYIDDLVIIEEPVNRHDKMLRLFPKAMTFAKAFALAKTNLSESLTKDEWERYAYLDDSEVSWLFDKFGGSLSNIEDPELQAYIKMGDPLTVTDNIRNARRWGILPKVKATMFWSVFSKHYPLIKFTQNHGRYVTMSSTVKDELIEYINMKYEKENS